MKINHYINNRIAAAWMLLLSLFLLPACSNDEDGPVVEEQKYRTLEITINSLSNNSHTTRTKAGETVTIGDDSQYEHWIGQYWLVVLKQDVPNGAYLVDKVITKDDVDNNNLNSETTLTLEVEIGKNYRFYALANLAGLNGGSSLITELEGLQSGANFDTFLEKAVSVLAMENYHAGNEGSYIPMTSYGYDQYVSETTSSLESGPIALIRLIGKVSLEIRNLTSNAITLNSLKMGEFRTSGDIFLFPYDLANGTRNLLKTDMQDTYRPVFPNSTAQVNFAEVTLVGEKQTIQPYDENNPSVYTVYLNESTKDDNSDLMITADIENRYNKPLSSGFSFVRRNDWLKLPIQISDVVTNVTIDQQHMPIGGLPYSLVIPEVAFPVVNYETDHAGDITFSVSLTSVSSMTNPTLKFYNGKIEGSEVFTAAVLNNNNGTNTPLLINLPEDSETWPIDEVSFPLTQGTDKKSFTFKVTAQELSSQATAVIDLSLVIEEEGKSMTIPYTINITFDANKGGN